MRMLENKTVLIVGGSSGIGLGIAKAALEAKANVMIASRSQKKLDQALTDLNHERAKAFSVDLMDGSSIAQLFDVVGRIDHLLIPASEVVFEPFESISIDAAKRSFDSKFWGPFNIVRAALPNMNQSGSITLFSGVAGQKPAKGTEVVTAINNAIDGLAKALAISLSPIRVNSISPGLIDTPVYKNYDKKVMDEIFDNFSKQLLIKRYGRAEEVASTAMYLMTNDYVTGTTQMIDGGRDVL